MRLASGRMQHPCRLCLTPADPGPHLTLHLALAFRAFLTLGSDGVAQPRQSAGVERLDGKTAGGGRRVVSAGGGGGGCRGGTRSGGAPDHKTTWTCTKAQRCAYTRIRIRDAYATYTRVRVRVYTRIRTALACLCLCACVLAYAPACVRTRRLLCCWCPAIMRHHS